MLVFINHTIARILRILPKHRKFRFLDMEADFFIPPNNRHLTSDLRNIERGRGEPQLYEWLNNMPKGAVFFDVGTSYGQEVSLASSLARKEITVIGFDCSLSMGHYCAINKALNNDRFRFVFAAVGSASGKIAEITTESNVHLPHLHRKNAPYTYEVMTIALDDFARRKKIIPTHIKIDVDGAETDVIKGCAGLLKNGKLREIVIEIDNGNLPLIKIIERAGFKIAWQIDHPLNKNILFTRD